MNDVRKPLGTVDSRWFFRPTRDSIERDCSAIFDIVIGIYIYISTSVFVKPLVEGSEGKGIERS